MKIMVMITRCSALAWPAEVPDLDCKAGNGIKRLDRYDQLAAYLLGACCVVPTRAIISTIRALKLKLMQQQQLRWRQHAC